LYIQSFLLLFFFVNIIDLTAVCRFIFHYDLHGNRLGFQIGPHEFNIGRLTLRMRQNQHAGNPIHRLKDSLRI